MESDSKLIIKRPKVMKIKIILLISILAGILSCKDKESSRIENLIERTWILETTSPVIEQLDFQGDMTYKITGLINNSLVNNGVAIETGFVTGEWNFDNNKITFLTAHVELNTNISDIDIPIVDSQPIGSFYGYQVNGIFQNSSDDTDMIIKIRGDTIATGSEYPPTVWIIEELTEKTLIVINGTEKIKYYKQ
jgi:hypothetical protein